MSDNTYYQQFDGIILSIRKYKENDRLIKIFTREYGKLMFFVRQGNKPNNKLRQISFPFLKAQFIGKINQDGLSFLNDYGNAQFPKRAMADIEANAYATHLCALVDASMEDREVDDHLFTLLQTALGRLEAGYDPVIISNIFEIQILPKFGISLQLQHCAICGQVNRPMDFSVSFSGLICDQHYYRDEHRMHWHPRAAYFIQLFQSIVLDKVKTIHMSKETKCMIREAIDSLYEEYVGIRLRSRSFISQLENLENPLDDKEENQYSNH